MRPMKSFATGFSGFRLWLMGFFVVLVILVVWLQSSDVTITSVEKYEFLVPRRVPLKGPDAPPILAYWILGSSGEKDRMLRVLRSIYHPRNQYLLQLDSSSYDYERIELARETNSERVFREFGNVNVVGRGYPVNRIGASGLAAVLHAAALLLKMNADWDWFIPFSASDYPLWTQDDILYAFSSLPRDLNFVGYSNDTAWNDNVERIVVDPNLWHKEKDDMFYAVETREKPNAFQIFGGSPWMILSRGFLDHCVTGSDNLPRKLLMYFNNVVSPLESYFHTILCNTPRFHNTTINSSMRYMVHGSDRNHIAITNTTADHQELGRDQSIFAGPFREDDYEIQEIDREILKREPNGFVPGKWCVETGFANETKLNSSSSDDFCSNWGDIDVVENGDEGIKLQKMMLKIVEEKKSIVSLCQSYVVQNDTKK